MKSLLRWTAASLAAVFLVSAPQKSQAQNVFLGNGTAVWSDAANWSGPVPDGVTPQALRFADAPTNATSTNDVVGFTALGINFTNGAPALWSNTTQNTTRFTLNGNKIILGGNIITSAQSHDGAPTNNRLIRDTINLDMDLNGNRTITTNQTGTNNVNQTQHALTINGIIGETAPGIGNLTKNGGQQLQLNGANTFTGGITVTAGTISVSNTTGGGFGTNVLRSSNGTFQFNGIGNQTMSNAIDLYNTGNQGATLAADGAGGANSTLTYNGALTTTGGNGSFKALTLTGGNTAGNSFVTSIANGVSIANVAIPLQLTKAGNGRWTVGPNNTYTGPTNIGAGTLNVSNLQDDLALPSSLGQNATGTIGIQGGQLRYAATTLGAQVVANRTITLNGTNNQGATILNDSANDGASNNTLVFSSPFLVPNGTQAKTLTLGGNNTGNNAFTTVIPNGPTAATILTKANGGNWIVSGNNTFRGNVNANGGELRVPVIDETFTNPQPLGISGNVSFNGGTLAYVGETSVAIANRTFIIAGGGGLRNNAAAGNTVSFSGTHNYVSGTAENNNTRTWTLGGGNTGANQYNTVIADAAPAVVTNGTFIKPTNLQKDNGGTWAVTGANTYSGATTIQQGNLEVTSIGNKGVAGNIGTGSNVGNTSTNITGNATIRLGLGGNTGALRYVGAGESTDRLFQIGQLTGNAVAPANQGGGGQVINNGTGALTLAGTGGFFNEAVNANSTNARVLTLGGNFAGINQVNATIQDNILVGNGTNAQVRLVKNGATTWALNGAQTYTGNTTVAGGTLLINGSTASGDMVVNAAGTLGGTGTVGGAATISGNLSPGNSPGLLTFASSLTLAANSTFTWELAGNTDAGRGVNFDAVDVGGALSIDPTATSVINTFGGLNAADPFWGSDKSWLVFDVAGDNYAGALFGSIGGTLTTAGLPGAFSWSTVSIAGAGVPGNVYLNYAIPEPSSVLLTVLGLAGAGLRRSRKNRS